MSRNSYKSGAQSESSYGLHLVFLSVCLQCDITKNVLKYIHGQKVFTIARIKSHSLKVTSVTLILLWSWSNCSQKTDPELLQNWWRREKWLSRVLLSEDKASHDICLGTCVTERHYQVNSNTMYIKNIMNVLWAAIYSDQTNRPHLWGRVCGSSVATM